MTTKKTAPKVTAIAPKQATAKAPETTETKPRAPKTYDVILNGKTYILDFSMRALIASEEQFMREGRYVNLLFCLSVSTLNLKRTRDLFAAAVRTHHQELTYDAAIELVTEETIYSIANVAMEALNQGKQAA